VKTATRLISVVVSVCIASALVGCYASEPAEPGDRLHATVPDLAGMTRDAAEEALLDAGYSLGEVSEEPAEGDTPGTVVSQSPIWGTSLPRDAAVDIVLATGAD
jgi:beta-lactam-binding protein with PASTA domain